MGRASTYKTKQREAVLECLKKNSDNHFTIEEIMEYLKTKNEIIGQTTIYRYVNTLVNDGMVIKYVIDSGRPACFQYIDSISKPYEDYHLQCDTCGKIFHMDCNIFKEMKEHLQKKHKFEINTTKIVLYGTCDNCIKNNG